MTTPTKPRYIKVPELNIELDHYANCTGCVAHMEDDPGRKTTLCKKLRTEQTDPSCFGSIYIRNTAKAKTDYVMRRLGVEEDNHELET